MYPAQCMAAAEQQPEGWRIVDPPPCLGGSTHRWVPVDTHSTPGARKGWLWVAHVIRQHSTQCINTPNIFSEVFFVLKVFFSDVFFFLKFFFLEFFFPVGFFFFL